MTTTGANLLTGFSSFIGDITDPAGLTTSAAGASDGSTLIDDTLGEYADDALVGHFIRITGSGSNQYLVRAIVKNEAASGLVEVLPPFAAQVSSSVTYELHRYDPRAKFTALDEARLTAYPELGVLAYDATITGDGRTNVFDIPSAIRRGPVQVYLEQPVEADVDWNFSGDPDGDDTTKWTASSVTASTVTANNSDPLVPKYGNESATKLVVAASTAGTYTQVVASMSTVTAAAAAGRKMTAAAWVYALNASQVRLGIIDDGTTTYSSYHQGKGWELLTVERTVPGNNATLLSVVVSVASGSALTAYLQKNWFYYGAAEKVVESWIPIPAGAVRRDNSTQQIWLPYAPSRGQQVRLVGRGTLTALGTTAATQVTNTMEVDEGDCEVLYSAAAAILFDNIGMNLSDYSIVSQNIARVTARRQKAEQDWGMVKPASRIQTMWA